jgi:hypothetical protein
MVIFQLLLQTVPNTYSFQTTQIQETKNIGDLQ